MIFIHVMLNDICLPCCHLPKTLFHDTPAYSVWDVPISTQIIATVYQKLHWQYPKWHIGISGYRYQNDSCNYLWHINQFILWSLKSTVNYNYMYNNFYTHETLQLEMTNTYNNFLQKNDLIWVMKYINHTLTITILPCSSSLMHNFLHAKRLHKVIWHKTYIFNIYKYAYH